MKKYRNALKQSEKPSTYDHRVDTDFGRTTLMMRAWFNRPLDVLFLIPRWDKKLKLGWVRFLILSLLSAENIVLDWKINC